MFTQLSIILILMSEYIVSMGTVYSLVVALIFFCNACYYVGSSIMAYVHILKIQLGSQAIRECRMVDTNKQARSLVRYFENRSSTFLSRYWNYFNDIVKSLKPFRLSISGSNVDCLRVDGELRHLERMLKQKHLDEARDCREYLDGKNNTVAYSSHLQFPECIVKYRTNEGGQCGSSYRYIEVPDIISRLAYQHSSNSEADLATQVPTVVNTRNTSRSADQVPHPSRSNFKYINFMQQLNQN